MTYENYVKARLVDFVMGEAGHHGGHESMLAIAQVLANRVKAGWQGGDWMKVIESAPIYLGTIVNRTITIDAKDLGFRDLLRKIDDIYHATAEASYLNNDNGSALYYAQLNNINRAWFKVNILSDPESHPRLAQVGPLTFFG